MTYQASVLRTLDGPRSLQTETLEDPPLQAGHVRIDVRAAGVNFPDLLMTRGEYQHRPELPFSPGMEVAGVVSEVGDASRFRVGQPVIALGTRGGFARRYVSKEGAVLPMPEGFSFAEAATFAVAGITARNALVDAGRVQAGETVLVAGASGGVGRAAVQLAVAKGARVIALASGAEKSEAARAAGAEIVIDYAEANLKEAVREATDGDGAHLVYDPVGGELAQTLLSCLGWGGRYLIVGFASGDIPSFPANRVLMKAASVHGVRAGESYMRDPKLAMTGFADLIQLASSGAMTPLVSRTYPLTEADDALAALAERAVIGRVALVMEEGS